MDNHQTSQATPNIRVSENVVWTEFLIGAVLAAAIAIVCLYTEALAWGLEAFVVLGVDLQPTSFSTTAPPWPIIVSGSLLTAAGAYALLNRDQRRRRWQLTGATAVGVVIFAAALIANARIPAETTISLATGWERFAYFLSTSTGFATFVGILFVAWIVDFRSRHKETKAIN